MRTCPACAAAVEAADARFCGRCGALLDDAVAPAAEAPDDSPVRGRGPAVVVVLVLVGLVVAGTVRRPAPVEGPEPDVGVPIGLEATPVTPATGAAGAASRVFAREGLIVWERALATPPLDGTVVALGPDHVLVGDRVVPTARSAVARDVLALPAAVRAGAFDTDGSWAVAEAGRLVLGGPSAGVAAVPIGGDWRPTGGAVAWVDGEPVLADADGRLGRVARDGTVRWRTEAVGPVGVVGARWLAAGTERVVAVALDDGRVVDLPTRPLAFHDDLAVLPLTELVGRDLVTGTERWRRADAAGRWSVVGDDLVVVAAGVATRLDPATGEERGSVTGFVPAATDAVVVSQVRTLLRAASWDGEVAWERPLDARATHVVTAVDDARIAVRSDGPEGVRVTVLRAGDGETLTVATVPRARGRALATDATAAAVLGDDATLLAVDPATGADVAAGPRAPTEQVLDFGVGDARVEVTVGVAVVEGGDRWSTILDAPVVAGPARGGTGVLLGLADGSVLAIAPSDGSIRWRSDLGVQPTALASDGTQLLVGTADGRVLRLDPSGATVTTIALGNSAVEAVVPGRPALALVADRLVGLGLDG